MYKKYMDIAQNKIIMANFFCELYYRPNHFEHLLNLNNIIALSVIM